MKKVFKMAATLFAGIAAMEVGAASIFLVYQPEQPKK